MLVATPPLPKQSKLYESESPARNNGPGFHLASSLEEKALNLWPTIDDFYNPTTATTW